MNWKHILPYHIVQVTLRHGGDDRNDYPGLFYCAMRILNIPGSSVPYESLFSEAGDQVTKKRNRLDPERVNKMMVVEKFYS